MSVFRLREVPTEHYMTANVRLREKDGSGNQDSEELGMAFDGPAILEHMYIKVAESFSSNQTWDVYLQHKNGIRIKLTNGDFSNQDNVLDSSTEFPRVLPTGCELKLTIRNDDSGNAVSGDVEVSVIARTWA